LRGFVGLGKLYGYGESLIMEKFYGRGDEDNDLLLG